MNSGLTLKPQKAKIMTVAVDPAKQARLIGIACIVGAVTIFSLQDLTFKWMSHR